MKKLLFASLTFGILTFQSCTDGHKSNDTETQISSLAGKIYSSSDGIDTVKCEGIPPATDYWQTLLFIDDSVFIKIINTCCPDEEEDFAAEFYYSGKYKMDDKMLTLTFDPKQAVYYVKVSPDKNNDTLSIKTEHVELEPSDIKSDNLDRYNCKDIPYFKQKNGDFNGEVVALENDTLENYIQNLKDRKIWSKLFGK